jgi:hypothetical protein
MMKQIFGMLAIAFFSFLIVSYAKMIQGWQFADMALVHWLMAGWLFAGLIAGGILACMPVQNKPKKPRRAV